MINKDIPRIVNIVKKSELNKILKATSEIISRIEKSDATSDFILELLDYAKQDIDSCKVLYNSKIYSQSTYHLQQAVEKITKAYGLYLGVIRKKDLQLTIGHSPPQMFLMLVQKKWIKEFIEEINKYRKEKLPTDISILNKIVRRDVVEPAKISKEQIMAFLDALDKIEASQIPEKELSDLVNMILARIDMDEIISRYKENKSLDEFEKKLISIASKIDLKNVNLGDVLQLAYYFATLYLFSTITFKHLQLQFVRYPKITKDDKTIKIQDYKPGLGIVDMTLPIVEKLESSLKFLEKILKT